MGAAPARPPTRCTPRWTTCWAARSDREERGHARDGKKGLPQIEYALLTDPAGCPVAFTAAVTAVKDTLALENMVMVGDRGMITTARNTALKRSVGWAG